MQSYAVKQEIKAKVAPPRSMLLPMGFAQRRIYGGPYMRKPDDMYGVKLAPEVVGDSGLYLPINDFSVPQDPMLLDVTIITVLGILADNDTPVYVGCLGGMGRTGLFLSLLAKTMGVPKPVQYVRDNYYERAVETGEQRDFVSNYRSPLPFWSMLALKFRALRHGLVEKV